MGLSRMIVPMLGLGMAVAGFDKLAGNRSYRKLFEGWGWSRKQMNNVATAELIGGALLIPRQTRRLGGGILAAASGVVLVSELQYREPLAAPRMGVLMVALTALLR